MARQPGLTVLVSLVSLVTVQHNRLSLRHSTPKTQPKRSKGYVWKRAKFQQISYQINIKPFTTLLSVVQWIPNETEVCHICETSYIRLFYIDGWVYSTLILFFDEPIQDRFLLGEINLILLCNCCTHHLNRNGSSVNTCHLYICLLLFCWRLSASIDWWG
jgi:hypothetical protein